MLTELLVFVLFERTEACGEIVKSDGKIFDLKILLVIDSPPPIKLFELTLAADSPLSFS